MKRVTEERMQVSDAAGALGCEAFRARLQSSPSRSGGEQRSEVRMNTQSAAELRQHEKYDRLIARCKGLAPIPTAVAHPCDDSSLSGAIDAAEAGIILPILVGPIAKIRAVAEKLKFDLGRYDIVDVPHSHAAAEKAVELVRLGKAELLMKGSLHTDELMAEVVRKDTGLRTDRRISHVFIMDVPTYPKPLFITDAAVNIFPTLDDKVDILKNAIDLAKALEI